LNHEKFEDTKAVIRRRRMRDNTMTLTTVQKENNGRLDSTQNTND